MNYPLTLLESIELIANEVKRLERICIDKEEELVDWCKSLREAKNERRRLNRIKNRPKYRNNAVIYKIYCKDKEIEDYYIGSSINFTARIGTHKQSIINPTHSEYNSYKSEYIRNNGGWDNWIMEVIEKFSCDGKDELETQEFTYIDGTCLNTITHKKTKEEKEEESRMWKLERDRQARIRRIEERKELLREQAYNNLTPEEKKKHDEKEKAYWDKKESEWAKHLERVAEQKRIRAIKKAEKQVLTTEESRAKHKAEIIAYNNKKKERQKEREKKERQKKEKIAKKNKEKRKKEKKEIIHI